MRRRPRVRGASVTRLPPPGLKARGDNQETGRWTEMVRGEERGAIKIGEGRGAKGDRGVGEGRWGKWQGAIQIWERGEG